MNTKLTFSELKAQAVKGPFKHDGVSINDATGEHVLTQPETRELITRLLNFAHAGGATTLSVALDWCEGDAIAEAEDGCSLDTDTIRARIEFLKGSIAILDGGTAE